MASAHEKNIETRLGEQLTHMLYAVLHDISQLSEVALPTSDKIFMTFADMCVTKKERPKNAARFTVSTDAKQYLSFLFQQLACELGNATTCGEDTIETIAQKLRANNATGYGEVVLCAHAMSGETLTSYCDRTQWYASKLGSMVPADQHVLAVAKVAVAFEQFLKAVAFRIGKIMHYRATSVSGGLLIGILAGFNFVEQDLDAMFLAKREKVTKKAATAPAHTVAANQQPDPVEELFEELPAEFEDALEGDL